MIMGWAWGGGILLKNNGRKPAQTPWGLCTTPSLKRTAGHPGSHLHLQLPQEEGGEIIQEYKSPQMLVVNELWILFAFNELMLVRLSLNQQLFWTAGEGPAVKAH